MSSFETFTIKRLKIARTAFDRERNPDWYDPTFVTKTQLGQINALLGASVKREVALTASELIARADQPTAFVLAAFDGSDLEQANVVAIGGLVFVTSLTEKIGRLCELAFSPDLGDAMGLARELVRLMNAEIIALNFDRIELSRDDLYRLLPDGVPTKRHRRMTLDLDITEAG